MTRATHIAVALLVLATTGTAIAAEPSDWKAGIAAVKVTPEGPIRMAGYASRNKPSEGVLMDLWAKALVLEDGDGRRGLLLTADLIGFNKQTSESLCRSVAKRTGLAREQILLNVSHTHTGPYTQMSRYSRNPISDDQQQAVERFLARLHEQLADVSARAMADLRPARLTWGSGTAPFVMNRRQKTDGGVRLGVNPEGFTDKAVPVLRIDDADGAMRAVVFGCACHNTTLTGQHYEISGDYAGYAQQYVQEQHPGVQAMFVIGCGGDANPHPRGTVENAKAHGKSLGGEVCRVAAGKLHPINGPLHTALAWPELPLAPVPPRDRLKQMAAGPNYIAYNARRMIEVLDRGESLPTHYAAPVAVWQFGDDLTLVALPGETVSDFVPMVRQVIGHERLWIAGYSNEVFGYLVSAKVIAEGGYETRGLFDAIGFFTPKTQDVVVATVRTLAEK